MFYHVTGDKPRVLVNLLRKRHAFSAHYFSAVNTIEQNVLIKLVRMLVSVSVYTPCWCKYLQLQT